MFAREVDSGRRFDFLAPLVGRERGNVHWRDVEARLGNDRPSLLIESLTGRDLSAVTYPLARHSRPLFNINKCLCDVGLHDSVTIPTTFRVIADAHRQEIRRVHRGSISGFVLAGALRN
jgi:hypothetical protein